MNMLTDPTWLQVHYGCTGEEKASCISFLATKQEGIHLPKILVLSLLPPDSPFSSSSLMFSSPFIVVYSSFLALRFY